MSSVDGPDYLNDERPAPDRRRRVMVLVVVLVVVAGLGVARLAQLDTDKSSEVNRSSSDKRTPPTSSVTAPTRVAVPAGTLVVAAAGRINTLDLGSGSSRSTSVPFDPDRGSMTAVGDGVVVSPGGAAAARLLVAGGFALVPTPRVLKATNGLVAGTDSSVWASHTSDPTARSTWRLTDLEGQVETKVNATAPVISDGAGGLLEVDGRTLRQIYPRPAGPRLEGAILGVGPDGYIMRPCADPECAEPLNLFTRTTSSYTKLDFALPASVTGGALSVNNRLVALTENAAEGHRIEVRSMTNGNVLRSFPQARGSEAVWLDQRWLALVSDDHLVLYDSVTNTVTTPRLDLHDLGALAWLPT